jgi:hypothetical protein
MSYFISSFMTLECNKVILKSDSEQGSSIYRRHKEADLYRESIAPRDD